LCVNRKSVQRWLNAFLERGLDALRPRKAKGKASNIPAGRADEIKSWVIAGPAGVGLDRANWTYEEIAAHLRKAKGVKTSRSAVQRYCARIGIRPYRPTYRYLRGDPAKQEKAKAELAELKTKAAGGEVVLLSQDEARVQMVPTLQTTLGVKGHRPVVGTRDNKDVLYVFGVLNLISGALHTNTLESLQKENRKSTESKTRRMQRAFAEHLRHVGGMYPREKYKRVVLTIDGAPWHRGALVSEAMKENPHLELYPLPSYSPKLNVIERFWKKLRRRATHNRLFDTIKDLKRSVRNSLRYFQTVRSRLLSLINGRPKKSAK
jgi:transposase